MNTDAYLSQIISPLKYYFGKLMEQFNLLSIENSELNKRFKNFKNFQEYNSQNDAHKLDFNNKINKKLNNGRSMLDACTQTKDKNKQLINNLENILGENETLKEYILEQQK